MTVSGYLRSIRRRVALVGVRSLDPGEQALVRELGIAVYTISDLDRRGVEPVIEEALARISGGAFVHVSIDLDVVDPEFAPGVGDPVLGGLSYREAHLALELVAEAGVLDSPRARRGEPDPRSREHDGGARGRPRRQRAGRPNPSRRRRRPSSRRRALRTRPLRRAPQATDGRGRPRHPARRRGRALRLLRRSRSREACRAR